MRAELAALELGRLTPARARAGVGAIAETFAEHDLLTYSSAIAFQVLYAVVPVVLLLLAGFGVTGETTLYTHHIARTLRHALSADAYRVSDRTALQVMGRSRGFWLTIGLGVTVWGVGAAIRSTMTPLNAIYGAEETRSWKRRLLVSLGLAVMLVVLLYAALGIVLGGRLVQPHPWPVAVLFFLARWVVTLALLLLAIALLLRLAPAKKRPVGWISVGSTLSTICWIVATIGFGAYISTVSYSSFYGALAGIVLLLIYLHVAAIALLLGIVADARLRELVQQRGGD